MQPVWRQGAGRSHRFYLRRRCDDGGANLTIADPADPARQSDAAVSGGRATFRRLLRAILALAAPTSLVALLQIIAQLAETWIAARQGTAALAGWAVVLPFALLLQQMSTGAMGGGVVSAIARALGAGRTRGGVRAGAARAADRDGGRRRLRDRACRLPATGTGSDRRADRGGRGRRLRHVAVRARRHSRLDRQYARVRLAGRGTARARRTRADDRVGGPAGARMGAGRADAPGTARSRHGLRAGQRNGGARHAAGRAARRRRLYPRSQGAAVAGAVPPHPGRRPRRLDAGGDRQPHHHPRHRPHRPSWRRGGGGLRHLGAPRIPDDPAGIRRRLGADGPGRPCGRRAATGQPRDGSPGSAG